MNRYDAGPKSIEDTRQSFCGWLAVGAFCCALLGVTPAVAEPVSVLFFNDMVGTNYNFDRNIGLLGAGDTLYVSVGPTGTSASDHFELDYTLTLNGVSIAGYRDDYQTGSPAASWRYMYNSNYVGNSIGNDANYQNMVWNAPYNRYSQGFSSGVPFLTATGGHPGEGPVQGHPAGSDRYAITAFTLPQAGIVGITDSRLHRIAGAGGDWKTRITLHISTDGTVGVPEPGTAALCLGLLPLVLAVCLRRRHRSLGQPARQGMSKW